MNCDCRCNGKCKLLGALEQKIMEVLWVSSNPLSPGEVLVKLKDRYAYTTIMTVLKRMADKNIVTRQKQGNSYLYAPVQDKTTFANEMLQDLFERLFDSYGDFVHKSYDLVCKKKCK